MPSQNDRIEFKSGTPDVAVWAHVCGRSMQYTFQHCRDWLTESLLGNQATVMNRRSWQAMDVSMSDAHTTRELSNVQIVYYPPDTIADLAEEVNPDLPWADEHFAERVGRNPVNPPPSHLNWPWHGADNQRHIEMGTFSHTYPERFWPKFANTGEIRPNGRQVYVPHNGIRYEFGDLDDVVNQLTMNPYTRQAVLPIFFPEDTGAPGGRVPCTLSYHFMVDNDDRLNCFYTMRACDFVRHFHNDVYFAARLMQWMCDRLNDLGIDGSFEMGRLNMSIANLHVFNGDLDKL